MFCLYCGTNLPNDSIFCSVCGKKQILVSNNTSIFPTPAQGNVDQTYPIAHNTVPHESKTAGPLSRRTILMGLTGVAAVTTIGGIVTWLTKLQPQKRPLPARPPIGTLLLMYQGHANGVESVAWSPNGTRIVCGGNFPPDIKPVQVWEAI